MRMKACDPAFQQSRTWRDPRDRPQNRGGGEPIDECESRLISAGRGLGGAKPKSIVQIDGIEWVLKFASEYDHDWPLPCQWASMWSGRL
jgi:hypothetical protein